MTKMRTIRATFNALHSILIDAAAAQTATPEPAYDHSQLSALKAERDAFLRALAIIATDSSKGASTRDVYYRLRDQIERDVPPGTIAHELLTRYGVREGSTA